MKYDGGLLGGEHIGCGQQSLPYDGWYKLIDQGVGEYAWFQHTALSGCTVLLQSTNRCVA